MWLECFIDFIDCVFAVCRSEVPALCWDSAPRHQTWKPAGEQQLSAEGKTSDQQLVF